MVRIAEAHATAYTALEERCRTREVERHHALILVPDVHHPVELVITSLHLIYIKEGIPILAERSKCLVDLLGGIEFGNQGVGLLLVDHLRCLKLLVLLILNVAEEEYEVFRLARL